MRISTRSWHYRLNYWLRDKLELSPPPKKISLCKYFWTYMGLLVLAFLVILISPLLLLLFGLVNNIIIPLEERGKKKKRNKFYNLGTAQEEKPNIFIEFFKARKQKVCPIIEFVDS